LGVKRPRNPFAVRVSEHLHANPSTARVSEQPYLTTPLSLTMTCIFWYTSIMIKQLKNLGLLDRDFVTTLGGMLTLIVLGQVI